MGESLRRNNNEPESGLYYARVVRDFPLSQYSEDAKQRLTELNLPIPQANPIAIARAQQRPEGKGLFQKMFGMFNRRPDVKTDTGAGAVGPESGAPPSDGNGDFTINPKVVTPEPEKK